MLDWDTNVTWHILSCQGVINIRAPIDRRLTYANVPLPALRLSGSSFEIVTVVLGDHCLWFQASWSEVSKAVHVLCTLSSRRPLSQRYRGPRVLELYLLYKGACLDLHRTSESSEPEPPGSSYVYLDCALIKITRYAITRSLGTMIIAFVFYLQYSRQPTGGPERSKHWDSGMPHATQVCYFGCFTRISLFSTESNGPVTVLSRAR